MTIYEKYVSLEASIKKLEEELGEVKNQIVEEIKNLSTPYKNEYGTYSVVRPVKWTFSEKVKEKEIEVKKIVEEQNKQVADLKELEKTNGVAQKEELKPILRFTPAKK